jgi:two-component system, NtrC family, sensor kinase
MSFRAKIFLVLAVVGLLPVVVLGWLSFTVNRAELEKTVGRAQAAMAEEAARGAERTLARGIEGLRLSVGILPIFELAPDELSAALLIPYRQLDFVSAIAVLDQEGSLLARPAYGARKGEHEKVALTAADFERFLRRVPLELALQARTAMSTPYDGAGGISRVAVGLLVEGKPPRVVAAELSLAELDHGLRQLQRDGTLAYAVSADRTPIAGIDSQSRLSGDESALLRDANEPIWRLVTRADGAQWLASAARVSTVGWTVVVAQRADAAFRPAHRVRLYTGFWAAVALLLIAALGILLSRGLGDPIRQLSLAARALTEGRYDTRADVDSKDEIGQFAQAFNHMAGEVKKRDDEIRRWNADLQERVDQRTAELKEAQDQILRTRRLAALGSLGAGVAHELNNPLTAITGLLAVLRKELGDSPQAHALAQVQDQARRVAKIVSDLRQFADQERAASGRRFQLNVPVRAALDLYAGQIQQRGIRVRADLGAAREAQGDPLQIQQAVAHLVQNAIQAMPAGGELRVAVADVAGDALKLTISDTGRGIPQELRERIFDPFFTTKESANGVGLGLSISHSIVEAHHGRILVESAPGKGATFTVLLPAAAAAAHLS